MRRMTHLLLGLITLLVLGACSSRSGEPLTSFQPDSLSDPDSPSDPNSLTDHDSQSSGDALTEVEDRADIHSQSTEAFTEEPPIPVSVEPVNRTWPDGQSQKDQQGNVEVAVKPLNLNNPGETLDFEVALNTHSVDLSMDLAALSILTTDKGLSSNALIWDAPRGGHHVAGVLSFPNVAGESILLDHASHLTLTIREVDAAERSFTWTVQQ